MSAELTSKLIGLCHERVPVYRSNGLRLSASIDELQAEAASYAAQGRFSDATRTAEEALKLAAAGPKRLTSEIQNRLELYKAGRPYLEKPVAIEPAK